MRGPAMKLGTQATPNPRSAAAAHASPFEKRNPDTGTSMLPPTPGAMNRQ